MLAKLLPLALCVACAKAKPAQPPIDPPLEIVQQYHDASVRLTSKFLDGPWVVSRGTDGSSQHQGEALLWSGVAMAALSCEDAAPIALGLADMIKRNGGYLVRYEPLGDYAGGREITLDGAVGLYRGVAAQITRCPMSVPLWRDVLEVHLAAIQGGTLNPNAPARLGAWKYVASLLGSVLSVCSRPSSTDLGVLKFEIEGWVYGVVQEKAAAYRVNLALLTIQTLEELGQPFSHDGFCVASNGVDIPTVDAFCGRFDIRDYVLHYNYNQWEYRHQRSGNWEPIPDGQGLETPGLDLIVGLKQGYTL